MASSQFVVLRPNLDRVCPTFLAWALNETKSRARLRGLFKGTSIPFLPVADLASFEIAVPDLARQQAIVRVLELRERDADLRRRLDRALDDLVVAASRTSATH